MPIRTALKQQRLSGRRKTPTRKHWAGCKGFRSDDKTVRFTDADYFSFSKLRWTAYHFRELMPSVVVPSHPKK